MQPGIRTGLASVRAGSLLWAAAALVGCSDANTTTSVVTWQLSSSTASPTVLVGDQTTLSVEEVHAGVYRVVPNTDLTWRVVSGDAITVTTGVVVTVQPGTAVVEASRGGDAVTFTITVAPRPIVSIHLTSTLNLIRKDTTTTNVIGTDDRGTSSAITTAQLISRSPGVVQVLPDGRLIALQTGNAVVVAASGALQDSVTIQVGLGSVDQLGMQFASSVAAGDSVFATFSPVDVRGNPLTNVSISMSSGNTSVADVAATTMLSQNGVWIRSKMAGISNIHASSGSTSSDLILNVGPPRVIGILANAGSGFFFWQDSLALTTVARYSDGTLLPQSSGVTWSVVNGGDKFAVNGAQVKTLGPTTSGATRRDLGATAMLRASFGGFTADVIVGAGSQRPTTLIVAGPDSVTTGSTVTLVLAYLDSLGRVVPANRIVGNTSWAVPSGAVALGNNQWQVTTAGNAVFVAMYSEVGVGLVSGNKTIVVSDIAPPPPPPPPPPPSVYVQLTFVGSASPAVTAAFVAAQDRINSIIPFVNANPITFSVAAGACGTGIPAFNGTVQGVQIFAQVANIDGVGGILGQAGPCIIRSSGFHLPALGSMTFDAADLNNMATNGTLVPVILHEMFHVMGFGTTWGYTSYFLGSGTSDPRWTGPIAKGEYQLLGGLDYASGLPIENTGGPGTANSHWREVTFTTELMTGWIGSVAPLSRMTIASLADQGYQVSYAAADPYSLPSGMIAGWMTGAAVNIEAGELIEQPRFVVSASGNVAGIAGAPAWRNPFKP